MIVFVVRMRLKWLNFLDSPELKEAELSNFVIWFSKDTFESKIAPRLQAEDFKIWLTSRDDIGRSQSFVTIQHLMSERQDKTFDYLNHES